MPSIILSFVGNQDPFAKNDAEGSIVTLIRHLVATQHSLKRIFLLHTDSTEQNAIDTQHWLVSEQSLSEETIVVIPVNEALSLDPINQSLAVQEVRRAVELAQQEQTDQDTLEFNASSGTPAMKSSWGILQASGYVQRSHLWQVRNPEQQKPGQLLVFRDDVNVLKNEFDLKLIKQQIQDYDYSAALVTLQQSNLVSTALIILLQYGRCRLSLDFDRAYDVLQPQAKVYPKLNQEITALSSKKLNDRLQTVPAQDSQRKHEIEEANDRALLCEAYFKAIIRLKRREYSDFLVDIFRLLESIPKFLVQYQVGLPIPRTKAEINPCWEKVKQFKQRPLYSYLQNYQFANRRKLELNGFMNRYLLMAILEYFSQFTDILPAVQRLNEYCDQRNEYVHGFKGVSAIDKEHELIADLRKVLLKATPVTSDSPFDRLNQQICDLLDHAMQATQ
jgi:hypothetical protein